MTFAEGYFDSLYGRIESAWTVIDGKENMNLRSLGDLFIW
ncbi:hypothetical protein [uncultured Bacteroides sp.]